MAPLTLRMAMTGDDEAVQTHYLRSVIHFVMAAPLWRHKTRTKENTIHTFCYLLTIYLQRSQVYITLINSI